MFIYKLNSIEKLLTVAKNREYVQNNPELCKLLENPLIKDDTELAIHYNEYKLNYPDSAKKFVDYLLSKEAQTLVAQQGTIPVREDVEIPAKFNLPAPKEALEKSIKIDYIEAIKTKEDTIKKFSDIMQMKQ